MRSAPLFGAGDTLIIPDSRHHATATIIVRQKNQSYGSTGKEFNFKSFLFSKKGERAKVFFSSYAKKTNVPHHRHNTHVNISSFWQDRNNRKELEFYLIFFSHWWHFTLVGKHQHSIGLSLGYFAERNGLRRKRPKKFSPSTTQPAAPCRQQRRVG